MSNNKNVIKKTAGKGMRPIKGYNPKRWYANYDNIDWNHKTKKN